MKILILTHSFNSLTQRLWLELTKTEHQVSIEFEINHDITREAINKFQPDVLLGTYLLRKLPDDIIHSTKTLIVHPGPPGDQGPHSLDWAILTEKKEWGLSLLQATSVLDGGPIYAYRYFPLPPKRTKSSIYRHEVTQAAIDCLKETLEKIENHIPPTPVDQLNCPWKGSVQEKMTSEWRRIDPHTDTKESATRKVLAADSHPGCLIVYNDCEYLAYDLQEQSPIQIPVKDGSIGIGYLKKTNGIKLPVTGISKLSYERRGPIGFIHFPYYNGAFSAENCKELENLVRKAQKDDSLFLVLCGGPDFFCNGIHLNVIENAKNPGDESWRNINAMNDLVQCIFQVQNKITISALQGNAGAGGVYLALASDLVWVKEEVVLNPHYKNMGNLYGSEYWTYSLPRRLSPDKISRVREYRLPIDAQNAKDLGLIDQVFSKVNFLDQVENGCLQIQNYNCLLQKKQEHFINQDKIKPLGKYRHEELEKMKVNFYGFDPSYHVARSHFVHKVRPSRTPLYLANHRQ